MVFPSGFYTVFLLSRHAHSCPALGTGRRDTCFTKLAAALDGAYGFSCTVLVAWQRPGRNQQLWVPSNMGFMQPSLVGAVGEFCLDEAFLLFSPTEYRYR